MSHKTKRTDGDIKEASLVTSASNKNQKSQDLVSFLCMQIYERVSVCGRSAKFNFLCHLLGQHGSLREKQNQMICACIVTATCECVDAFTSLLCTHSYGQVCMCRCICKFTFRCHLFCQHSGGPREKHKQMICAGIVTAKCVCVGAFTTMILGGRP